MKTKEEVTEEMLAVSNKIVMLKRDLKETGNPAIKEQIKILQTQIIFYMETIKNMKE